MYVSSVRVSAPQPRAGCVFSLQSFAPRRRVENTNDEDACTANCEGISFTTLRHVYSVT